MMRVIAGLVGISLVFVGIALLIGPPGQVVHAGGGTNCTVARTYERNAGSDGILEERPNRSLAYEVVTVSICDDGHPAGGIVRVKVVYKGGRK